MTCCLHANFAPHEKVVSSNPTAGRPASGGSRSLRAKSPECAAAFSPAKQPSVKKAASPTSRGASSSSSSQGTPSCAANSGSSALRTLQTAAKLGDDVARAALKRWRQHSCCCTSTSGCSWTSRGSRCFAKRRIAVLSRSLEGSVSEHFSSGGASVKGHMSIALRPWRDASPSARAPASSACPWMESSTRRTPLRPGMLSE